MPHSDTGTTGRRRRAAPFLATGAVLALAACAGGRAARVSPAEIPSLEAQLARQPNNGPVLLRYAAALYAAERCDSAAVVALSGMVLEPENALGPLVLGACFERDEEWDQALATYRQFLAANPEVRGSGAVRARERLALRSRANARARDALARESDLAQQPGDPQTLAVLPIDIAGDSSYQPLSRGLAEMITSDLALLGRFRLVERMQVSALLNELQLGQTERVDAGTAARVGRLLQAGRMVQGLAQIPTEREVRLEASVVRSDGQILTADAQSGRLRDLLRMEKEVVIGIASQLGYVLSQAERQMILENGTQDLLAFLAYSRGLVAENLGDFSAAAAYFGEAARRDPGFTTARTSYQATAGVTTAQQAAPADVTTAASEPPPQEEAAVAGTVDVAVQTTVQDVAVTQGEQQTSVQTQTTTTTTTTTTSTTTTTTTTTADPNTTTTTTVTSTNVTGTIVIVFRLP